jgi:DNA-binding transcriptional LysR family regulator
MELRQLEYFVAVAEEQNFTRAAERVHISQSGVSAQIRQLERELGAELFDRSARTATLTVAGKAALEHARATLAAAGAVSQAVGEVADLIRGRLTVGMVIGCIVTPLFDALAAFHRAHPGVEISLLEDNSDRLVERVREGTVDLALVGTALATPDGLDALTIISERLVAAVPAGHPVAKGRRVTLRDLVAYPIVCMPPGTGLRTVFDQACAEPPTCDRAAGQRRGCHRRPRHPRTRRRHPQRLDGRALPRSAHRPHHRRRRDTRPARPDLEEHERPRGTRVARIQPTSIHQARLWVEERLSRSDPLNEVIPARSAW